MRKTGENLDQFHMDIVNSKVTEEVVIKICKKIYEEYKIATMLSRWCCLIVLQMVKY